LESKDVRATGMADKSKPKRKEKFAGSLLPFIFIFIFFFVRSFYTEKMPQCEMCRV
jgi:hypothetical protein